MYSTIDVAVNITFCLFLTVKRLPKIRDFKTFTEIVFAKRLVVGNLKVFETLDHLPNIDGLRVYTIVFKVKQQITSHMNIQFLNYAK